MDKWFEARMAAPAAGTFSSPMTVVLASNRRPGPIITLDSWYFTKSSRVGRASWSVSGSYMALLDDFGLLGYCPVRPQISPPVRRLSAGTRVAGSHHQDDR